MRVTDRQRREGRRPRILQCIPRIGLGGSERVAVNLASGLNDEFDFEFFAVRGIEEGALARELLREMTSANLPVHCGTNLPMRLGGLLTSALELGRILRRVRPDLVHVHTEIPEAAHAMRLALSPNLRRIPLVRTIHNTVIWDFAPRLAHWCDRRLSHGYVTGVSSGAVEAFLALRSASRGASPPVSPRVVYNGIRIPNTHERGHPTSELRVVFGGRLERQKGADLLPVILGNARPRQPARLVIFGAGSESGRLRDLAARAPDGWTVEVEAPVHDFPQRLSEFDLCLMPSRYEGLGLVAVEALLAGLPVVATHAPGLAEVFPPGYPWLARPDDALAFARVLQAAFESWENAPRIVAEAQAFARDRFSLPSMLSAYRALYHEALGAP